MKRLIILIFLISNTFSGYSQSLKTIDLVVIPEWIKGTWKLVSVENIYPNGDKVYPYGDHPKGLLIFDVDGNYELQIFKAVRITVASGDKNKCTPEENAALVQGGNSHFGKYSIDEAGQTVTFNIEYASFPNWNFTRQKRSYSYKDDRFQYVVTNTTQGGESVIAQVTWERAKGGYKLR